jgi:drug/metabolite transporter (DMT)-like permease
MNAADWGLFLTLSLLWGSSFMWIKIAVGEVAPLGVVGWRLLFGVVGLVPLLVLRRQRLPREWGTWRNLFVQGMVNTAIPFALIAYGEQTVDSAVASVLNSTVPLFTLLIAHFGLQDDRITSGRVLGLAVGFCGVLLLLSRDLDSADWGQSVIGQLAILAGALSYAFGSVFARRNLRTVDPYLQASIPLAWAGIAIWSLAFVLEPGELLPATPLPWLALVWLGLLNSCLAYLVYYHLLHRVGPTRTTLVTYLMALIGVVLGVVFLGEPLDWRLTAGALLVVSGIAIVGRLRRPAAGRASGTAG